MTNRSELTSAWALYTADQQLSDDERALLEQALHDDTSAGELADDQRLHRMLQALGTIDKTRDDFVSNVLTGCSIAEPQVAITQPSLAVLPQSLSAQPATTSAVRRRNSNKSLLFRPLVLILSGGTLAMAIMSLLLLNKYQSVYQRAIAAEQQLKTQQITFKAQLDAERNRQISQPPPAPHVASTNAVPLPQITADVPVPAPSLAGSLPVATLVQSDNAVWKNPPITTSLQAGRWDLERGTAQLAMPGGSQLELQAPAMIELLSPQHVSLDLGHLTATVPAADIGFKVSTPNARIVDLGTQFRVTVDERGETDVDVDQGEVVVIPWDADNGGKRWHLVAGEFDAATICPSPGGGQNMLASRVTGPAGFQGQIRLAGASMDLASRDHFDRLRDGVTAQFATSPDAAIQNWLELTQTFATTSGSITMNGKEVPFNGLDGVLDFENSLMNMGDFPAVGNSQQNSVFVGKVNINGQERSFQSQEEYEAFRKEMLQSLQGFGLQSPAQMQLELDKQKNPFKP